MRRMDRYKDTSDVERISRSDSNKELYESLGSNTKYTSFTDVTNANAIDLSSKKNYNTREGYHQLKEYRGVEPTPRVKKSLDEFKSIYQRHENRVYDINNVLEEARKNRIEKDELEEKRKLKNTSYNILASLNPEELEKYRQEKRDKLIHASDDDLRELIDTITSATLAGDIKVASELLGDLMATSIMEKISDDKEEKEYYEEPEIHETIEIKETKESEEEKESDEEETEKEDEEDYKLTLSKEILDLQELKKITDKYDKEQKTEPEKVVKELEKDEDFYTRSMDLSDQDFEMDDEFKDKKMPIGIKLLIFLIILIVLAAVFYFIWELI